WRSLGASSFGVHPPLGLTSAVVKAFSYKAFTWFSPLVIPYGVITQGSYHMSAVLFGDALLLSEVCTGVREIKSCLIVATFFGLRNLSLQFVWEVVGMKVIRKRKDIIEWSRRMETAGERIVLVPTMGALHEGHLSLVDRAAQVGTKTVVSIFVNPKQFNIAADLERYPRDEGRDIALLNDRGVDVVFAPEVDEVYPENFSTQVAVSRLTERWEGAGRPGHFEGVTTVVSLLFHLIAPEVAIFGEKDFQQLRVIEQMVRDLGLRIEILRAPLIRESDGLAMSSRNVRLSAEGREKAVTLSRSLTKAVACAEEGRRDVEEILTIAKEELRPLIETGELVIDYLVVVDEENLEPITELSPQKTARILLTASLEGIRLLDNMPLPLT
ncbi:MAG: pantoate--beta-alanine ligase, partial [Bdellovibrionota bacterium]